MQHDRLFISPIVYIMQFGILYNSLDQLSLYWVLLPDGARCEILSQIKLSGVNQRGQFCGAQPQFVNKKDFQVLSVTKMFSIF